MVTYRTWLLVDQPPDADEDPLLTLLRSLSFPVFVAGGERPAVGLRIEGGVAMLVGKTQDDLRGFFELVRTKRLLLAFALHSARALREQHGMVFRTAGSAVQLLGDGGPPGVRDPYFRRMIRFQSLNATSLDPTKSHLQALVDTIKPHERLLLDPRPLLLNQAQAAEVSAAMSIGLLSDAKCLLLPPAVDPASLCTDSYFHAIRVELRSVIAAATDTRAPWKGEPLAVRLWRLHNDESMLDVLREGASLNVVVREDSPVEVTCAIPGSGLDAVAKLRGAQLLNPDSVAGPAWAREVAAAVALDVQDAATGAGDADLPVALSASASSAADERIPELPQFEPREAPRDGLWQLLKAIKERMPEGAPERDAFHEAILWPSNNDSRWAPDHGLALKAFMAFAWRCPWSPDVASADTWADATIELIEESLHGSRSAAALMQRTSGWPRATVHGDQLSLTLLPSRMTDALRWALLLPVGSIVKSGGVITLDDPHVVLDDEFVLA